MKEIIVNINDAATMFGVSRYAVDGWIRSGKISAVKTSPHRRGIYRSELDRFIEENDLVVSGW